MRHLASTLLLLGVLSALLSSCSREVTGTGPSSSLSPGDSPVVTDAATYHLESNSTGWVGRVGYTFTNRTDRTISLLNCRGGYGVTLQKRQGDEWVNAWSPVLLQCLSAPINIAPGESLGDGVEIVAGRWGSNNYPQFSVAEIDGLYRLVIGSAYWSYDPEGPAWGEEVPEEHRVSNHFEIRTSR